MTRLEGSQGQGGPEAEGPAWGSKGWCEGPAHYSPWLEFKAASGPALSEDLDLDLVPELLGRGWAWSQP